jgi:hypothetical protein
MTAGDGGLQSATQRLSRHVPLGHACRQAGRGTYLVPPRWRGGQAREDAGAPGAGTHHVVRGPIRILPMILLYMILPHPFCTQWSCRPGHVSDERGPQADPKLRRPYRRAKHGRRASARTVPQCGRRSPSGDRAGSGGSLPPRHFAALWFLPYGRIARDSLHLTSGWRCHPPRGDSGATCAVEAVGRVPRLPPEAAAGLARTRALQGVVTAENRGFQGTCPTLSHTISFPVSLVSVCTTIGPELVFRARLPLATDHRLL